MKRSQEPEATFFDRVLAVFRAAGIESRCVDRHAGVLKTSYFTPAGRECAFVLTDPRLWRKAEPFILSGQDLSEQTCFFVLTDLDDAASLPQTIEARRTSLATALREVLRRTSARQRSFEQGELAAITRSQASGVGIAPLMARIHAGTGRERTVDDLVSFLGDAIESSTFIAVLGGFGRGKTTSLYALAARLAERFEEGQSRFFPLFVNTAGWATQGLEEAIHSVLVEEFAFQGPEAFDSFTAMLGDDFEPVLLLDSLDEQEVLHPKETARLVNQLVSIAKRGPRVVCAFRPEVLAGEEELDILLKRRLAGIGLPFHFCHLLPLPERVPAALKNVNLDPAMEATVKELSARPLWLSYIARLAAERGLDDWGLVETVEECIRAWSSREATTRRPVLIASQREGLTMLLAYGLHTGTGPAAKGAQNIGRSTLLTFLRRVLEGLYFEREEMREITKWLDLSRDLAAESVAVANLLTTDRQGRWRFSERIFFEYYLARAFCAALSDDRSVIARSAFLDEVGVTRSEELLGVAPLPIEKRFKLILRDFLGRGETARKVRAGLEALLAASRPQRHVQVPTWEKLVVGEQDLLVEEERSYEIAAPGSWPTYHSAFACGNAVRILSLAEEAECIVDMDLSYVDLVGADLSGLEFRNCRLLGADLSYTLLDGTRFVDCILEDALFFATKEADVNHLRANGALVIESVSDLQSSRSESVERLESLRLPGERWLMADGLVSCEEMASVPVSLRLVLMDIAPVSNDQFLSFLQENPVYSREQHALDIENDYYLLHVSEDYATKPVVYVSLVAATAYALWQGKRLPTFFELVALERGIRGLDDGDVAGAGFSEVLPDIKEGEPYPLDLLSEWTYQIDDFRHWESIWRDDITRDNPGVWRLPPYRRLTRARCEYLVWGKSYQRQATIKNSKPATWLNPDQGFRCVTDYRRAVQRSREQQQ